MGDGLGVGGIMAYKGDGGYGLEGWGLLGGGDGVAAGVG